MPKSVNDNIKKYRRSAVLPPCRVTENERTQIKANANTAQISLSEYQRRVCLDGKIVVHESKVDAALIRHLLAIGKNLNQLTKISHIRSLRNGEQERLNVVLIALQKSLDDLL